MAAGTQNQGAALNGGNGDGTGSGQASGTGDGGSTGNGTDGSNAGNGSGEGSGSGDGTGAAGTDGSGDGANGGDSGNHGFDGTYDPERARTLINTLREENKGYAKTLKEMRTELDALKAAKPAETKEVPATSEGGTDSAAEVLAELRKMQNDLAEEKRLARFQSLATGMHPDAVSMAYDAAKGEFEIDGNGVVVNMTSVVDSLRQRQPFLFAPVTNGQAQGGSAGGGTNTAGGGKLYDGDEKASMKAFGYTPEQWETLKSGQPLPKA